MDKVVPVPIKPISEWSARRRLYHRDPVNSEKTTEIMLDDAIKIAKFESVFQLIPEDFEIWMFDGIELQCQSVFQLIPEDFEKMDD